MTQKELASLRKEYGEKRLEESEVDANPFVQFARWFDEALRAGMVEPNATALASSTPDGQPSVRMVLLKSFDERGFVFFTNYRSQKARELDANPRASLLFFWDVLQRQVRISGSVERTAADESREYFSTRPYASRIAALVSEQSAVISGREELERRFADAEKRYQNQEVPMPEWWGGYRVVPTEFEFWQGRENRLHDRLRYRRTDRGWVIERLNP